MTALLVIIYVAFIGLGLPDSLLGSAWPAMHASLGASISSGGVLSFIVAGGTIVSSLVSGRLIRRFGTSLLPVISVFMTAAALLGLSLAPTFVWACAWSIPLGLGAGAVDAALNSFVALHYHAMHMNWLHCFWGIGASAGPLVMSRALTEGLWRDGYHATGIALLVLTILLAASHPLWRRAQYAQEAGAKQAEKPQGLWRAARLPGVKAVLIALLSYCAIEATVGLWGSSYLVYARGIPADTAAGWISLYYLGITLGRAASGLMSRRLQARQLLALGVGCLAAGVALLVLPLGYAAPMAGLLCIGLGCAPIYPTLLHETPRNFGRENAQAVMGIQMACAYAGATLAPPLFGLLGGILGYRLLPLYIGAFLLLLATMLRRLHAATEERMVYAR